MTGKFSLDDYVDVAERIALFREKYPDGSLQRLGDPVIMDVAGKPFVMYTAAAYRTPDDQRPGIGTAWEPFPGPTQYTRDSELMNAETAAWGRALVAIGILANRKIASRQEVQARSGEARVSQGRKELADLQAEIRRNNPALAVLRAMIDGVGRKDIKIEKGWSDKLTVKEALGLIETFRSGVLPNPEAQDIPSDIEASEPVPVGAGDELPWEEAKGDQG